MKKSPKYRRHQHHCNFFIKFLSPRTSVNKRFCQIIFVSIIIVILLCGSFLLPFYLLKNTTNNEIHNDAEDETSGQGKTNEAKVDCPCQTGQQYFRLFSCFFSVLTTTVVPVGVTNFNRLENHQVRCPRTNFESNLSLKSGLYYPLTMN